MPARATASCRPSTGSPCRRTRSRPMRPRPTARTAWDRTVLVLVEAAAGGATGLGYTYADAATARFAPTTWPRS